MPTLVLDTRDPQTNSKSLNGWLQDKVFLLGWPIYQVQHVSFREVMFLYSWEFLDSPVKKTRSGGVLLCEQSTPALH